MKYIILAITLSSLSSTALATKFDCLPVTEAKKAANPPAPETVNLTRALNALPCIIKRAMNKTGVPGVGVAVVRTDKVLFAEGFGVREIGFAQKIDTDTVFQLASLSKAIGATAISKAVANGDVSWDDPIIKYLPWFQIGDKYMTQHVTIGDMYSHRSGLPDHSGDFLEDMGYDQNQILMRLSKVPTGPFRNQYAYTNFGVTAGAVAVAAALGTNWEQLSQSLLYQPAGMASSSSRYSDYLAASNRAITHQSDGNGNWFRGKPRDPQAQSPAGGVSSSVNDMARWLRLHLGNGTLDGQELIAAETLQIMRQPQNISQKATQSTATSSTYGFGTGTNTDRSGQVRWSHSGAFLLGTSTTYVMLPAADIAIVALTNGEPRGVPEAITAAFADIVETGNETRDWLSLFDQVFGAFFINPSVLANKTRPANPIAAQPLVNYAGTYQNTYYGPAEIRNIDGKLALFLGPVPNQYAIEHWDGDKFSYYPTGENAVGITEVSFNTELQTVRIENLDEIGLGTFSK